MKGMSDLGIKNYLRSPSEPREDHISLLLRVSLADQQERSIGEAGCHCARRQSIERGEDLNICFSCRNPQLHSQVTILGFSMTLSTSDLTFFFSMLFLFNLSQYIRYLTEIVSR